MLKFRAQCFFDQAHEHEGEKEIETEESLGFGVESEYASSDLDFTFDE